MCCNVASIFQRKRYSKILRVAATYRTSKISTIKHQLKKTKCVDVSLNRRFKNSTNLTIRRIRQAQVSLGEFIRREYPLDSYHVVRDRSTTTEAGVGGGRVRPEEGRKISFCMRIAEPQETSIHSLPGSLSRVHTRRPPCVCMCA